MENLKWVEKIDDVDDVFAKDINLIAHYAQELNKNKADNDFAFDYYYELNTAVENYNSYTAPGLYKIRHLTSNIDRTNVLLVTRLSGIRACLQLKIARAATVEKRQGNLLEDGTVGNWGEWVAYATKADVDDAKAYTDEKIGDIETALDTIIAMQNELTGGVEV